MVLWAKHNRREVRKRTKLINICIVPESPNDPCGAASISSSSSSRRNKGKLESIRVSRGVIPQAKIKTVKMTFVIVLGKYTWPIRCQYIVHYGFVCWLYHLTLVYHRRVSFEEASDYSVNVKENVLSRLVHAFAAYLLRTGLIALYKLRYKLCDISLFDIRMKDVLLLYALVLGYIVRPILGLYRWIRLGGVILCITRFILFFYIYFVSASEPRCSIIFTRLSNTLIFFNYSWYNYNYFKSIQH